MTRPTIAIRVSRLVILLVTFLAMSVLGPATLRGEDTSALINQELDKLVKLQVDGPLPQVIKTIADKTGVPISADQTVYELLPWGEQTNVAARIENQTLRQALAAITRKLGLTFNLAPETIRLVPVPALQRLGRRATVQELAALDLLGGNELKLNTDRPTLRQLVDAVDQKLIELKAPYAVEFRPGEQLKPDAPVSVPRNATIAEAMESLDADTDATWYPWGKSIVVLPKDVQIRHQLSKTVNLRFNGDDVSQVLADLSHACGIAFNIEPGAIQRVPPESRTIHLVLDNATVRQALESISGFTGLGYMIKSPGVYVWNSSPGSGGSSSPNGPVVATLQLDNGMQVFLREKDIPADIRQFAEHKKQREFERLRQMMKDENFQPTSQPTTRPVDKEKDL